jgi:hypothetical protein
MKSPHIQAIPLSSLLIDLSNPRHSEQASQRDAIATIAADQGPKLATLAQDIAERGLNPGDLPLVTSTDQDGLFTVVEGNRRIAALKLLVSPTLASSVGLPKHLRTRFGDLHKEYGASLPEEITCSVISLQDAHHWISQKHTGENDGAGIVMWDGLTTQRFRGMSPALQAIDLVKASNFIDSETKEKIKGISITNVERVLGTPEARAELGVEVRKGELILNDPEDEALARLAILVSDVANKLKKVTDLDSKAQRVAYAQEIAARSLPTLVQATAGAGPAAAGTRVSQKQATGQRVRPDRKMLIPQHCKVAIHHQRINRIYHELLKLNVGTFTNSAAVMFRVFLELSVDYFADLSKIVPKVPATVKPGAPPRQFVDLTLREKLSLVAQSMEDNRVLTTNELRGIRMVIGQKDHFLSVDNLNAYVHNKDLNPVPSDIKATWDNLEKFVLNLYPV